jgi:putative copper resistance protein D
MTTAVLVLVRTLHIGSAMLLVALPFFVLVTLKPALTRDAIQVHASFCEGVVRSIWIALLVEALSGIAWFWFVTAQMTDQSPWQVLGGSDLSAALGETQFGRLWMWRAGLGIALGAALSLVPPRSAAGRPLPSRFCLIALVLGGSLLVTLAWAGHAASGIHDGTLHLFADMLHLLIGAIWPMGLIPMGGFLWHLHRANRPALAEGEIAALQRFSQTSLVAVLAIVATGFINGWLMMGSWTALATTPYGQLLLLKIAVVALMIAVGGFNRFYVLPRLPADPNSLQRLRRTIIAESALAASVLLIVGIMGMTAPPS